MIEIRGILLVLKVVLGVRMITVVVVRRSTVKAIIWISTINRFLVRILLLLVRGLMLRTLVRRCRITVII